MRYLGNKIHSEIGYILYGVPIEKKEYLGRIPHMLYVITILSNPRASKQRH